MTANEFLNRFENVSGSNGQYSAKCPAHDDKRNSLSIKIDDVGNIAVHCHAGCTAEEVVSAVGIKMKDLFSENSQKAFPTYAPKAQQRVVKTAEYIYKDMQGNPTAKKIRLSNKSFYWLSHSGSGWKKGRKESCPLFHGYESRESYAVYVAEGEKDVINLEKAGFFAVSLPDGANSKWLDNYTDYFKNKYIAIIRDNDEPGMQYALTIAGKILDVAVSVKIIDLSQIWKDMPPKADISDYITAFPNSWQKDFNKLVRDTQPLTAESLNALVKNMEQQTKATAENTLPEAPTVSEWEEPQPFEQEKIFPAFPVDCLPDVLKNFVEAVSRSVQVDASMIILPMLSALATCVQKKFSVGSPQGNGHFEVLSLYTLTVAPPGSRKSAVMNLVTKPLTDFQNNYNDAHALEIRQYTSKKRMLEGKKDRLIKSGKGDEKQLAELDAELIELEKDKKFPLRLSVVDCTPEALATELYQQKEKISVLSSESPLLDVLAGSYQQNINLSLFLCGYDGENYVISRSTRPSITLKRPHISIGMMSQPKVFEKCQANETLTGRGFWQRFLFAFPPDSIAQRTFTSDKIPDEVYKKYADLCEMLLCIPTPESLKDTPILWCDENAVNVFRDFWNEINEDEKPGQPLCNCIEWSEKLFGKTLRIAGILHCVKNPTNAGESKIDYYTAKASISIAKWCIEEFLLTCGNFEAVEIQNAKYILQRLKDFQGESINKHTLMERCRKLKTAPEFDEPLTILLEKGYLKSEAQASSGRGRPAEKLLINPLWKRN